MIQPIQNGVAKLFILLENNSDVQASSITIQKKVLKQREGNEYGLYAISNVTSLAYGRDPINIW